MSTMYDYNLIGNPPSAYVLIILISNIVKITGVLPSLGNRG
jgi:hypothetical protein